jgi:hypothetical protein
LNEIDSNDTGAKSTNPPKNVNQIEKEVRRKEDENTKNENLQQQPDNITLAGGCIVFLLNYFLQ